MRPARFPHLLVIFGLAAGVASSAAPARRLASTDAAIDIELTQPEQESLEARVPPNATLQSLLVAGAVPADVAAAVVDAARGVFNPRDLRADQPYRITRTIDGLFQEFRYEIDGDNFLRVADRPGDRASSFDAEILPIPKDYRASAIQAAITPDHRTVVDAFTAAGENIQLPLVLGQVFGGELDFNSDLHMGDRVEALFDRALRDGEFVGYGNVNAAILQTGSRRIIAIRFVRADGQSAWYDEKGHSLKRQFLKSPLPFDPRVTSGFSSNRMHPILGMARPHLGVDFGAPYGTAVNAVAAGVIEVASMAGDAGRMVRIRHAGGYETAYLHLSSFGPGIRPGVRVEQGQLIGRVGQTGLATGPHLDYRIIRNGAYVNPLTEFSRTPLGEPVPPDQLTAFGRTRDDLLRQLQAQLSAPAR